MDITYHYPPNLLHLLMDTIPLLCRSAADAILFFKGAGVEKKYFADLEEEIEYDKEKMSKYEIVKTILKRLNERGEVTLRERQEVLNRVTEFEAFSSCLPDDQLIAQEFVSNIQDVVDGKDTFSRMEQESENEKQRLREEHKLKIKEVAEKKRQLEEIKQKLYSLFSITDEQQHGIILEEILNRLFKLNDIHIRESFKVKKEKEQDVGDRIDGEIVIEGQIYFVEMKWTKGPTDVGHVLKHLVRVSQRSGTHSIFISASGYTKPAIAVCQEALEKAVIILCTLEEIVKLLEIEKDLSDLFKKKLNAAERSQNPFLLILE